jgi:hypothetical protein
MNDVQPPTGNPVPDPFGGIAQGKQLPSSNHTMLPLHQIPRHTTQSGTCRIQRALIL